jgi:hypothetical protein
MVAEITIRRGGPPEPIVGVAVGYDDQGMPVVVETDLSGLGEPERRRMAGELRSAAARLDAATVH